MLAFITHNEIPMSIDRLFQYLGPRVKAYIEPIDLLPIELSPKVRLRGPAHFLNLARLSSAQKIWAHVVHYLTLCCKRSNLLSLNMKITHGKFPTSAKKLEYGKLPTWNLPTPNSLQKISYIYFGYGYGKFPTRKFPTII